MYVTLPPFYPHVSPPSCIIMVSFMYLSVHVDVDCYIDSETDLYMLCTCE